MSDISPQTPQGTGPLQAYRHLRREGSLRFDPVQELAAEKLETLHHRLGQYNPAKSTHWTDFLFRRKAVKDHEEPPQGLYIYGDVGRGKSMLMDLFFDTAPVVKKRRVHFHAFMQEVHGKVHAWRQAKDKKGGKPGAKKADDPIPPLAEGIASDAWLLCFDEMQVTDVADAMILGRLFEKLFDLGVVVVCTSNRHPDDLYKDGLNRQLFLPFLDLFKSQLDLLHLDHGTDYRLMRLSHEQVFFSPLGAAATGELDRLWRDLTEGAEEHEIRLPLKGRELVVPRAARAAARLGFKSLCARPLGAADYLALAGNFHTLVLEDVPKMGPEQRNEAKRFVTLVDVLYEKKVNLIMAADCAIDDLYPAGDGSFEFARTVSRLMEMQSEEYLKAEHVAGM